ncbi:MAG: hypothetical protein BAA01_15035 [Bacillus thermozeamaize]|uniref:Calcineurin-like phosphoesterase domain-containing protein n=1 Tax=Bacillus thermozeamaize TaxID=230954 RepID=A0A1Y3PEW6_9BACI|nr:MAG: hypothetical protein BAA01_15035 [Bacillus thermozeamaize]
MRIALISDVHANPVALEAVMADIRERQADQVICLGDLVGAGPDPAAVVDRIRELNIPVVRGNWDEAVVKNTPFKEDDYVREHLRFTRERLQPEHLDYLAQLPLKREWEWDGVRLEVFHANPENVMDVVPPDASPAEVARQMRSGAAIVAYGHIHRPYVRWLDGKALISVGYCSLHLDGDPRAAYTLLELARDGAISVTQRRIPYDRQQVVRMAEKAGLPVLDGFRRLMMV